MRIAATVSRSGDEFVAVAGLRPYGDGRADARRSAVTRIPVLRSRSPVAGLRRRSLRPPGVFAQSVSSAAPAGGDGRRRRRSSRRRRRGDACGRSSIADRPRAARRGRASAVHPADGRGRRAVQPHRARAWAPAAAFACAVALLVGYGLLVAAAFAGRLPGTRWRARRPGSGGSDALAVGAGVALVVRRGGRRGGVAVRGVRLSARVVLAGRGRVDRADARGASSLLALARRPAPPARRDAGPPGLGGIAVGRAARAGRVHRVRDRHVAGRRGAHARSASMPRAVTATAAVAGVLYLLAA